MGIKKWSAEELVRFWNLNCNPGRPVSYQPPGAAPRETKTKEPAFVHEGLALVLIEGAALPVCVANLTVIRVEG